MKLQRLILTACVAGTMLSASGEKFLLLGDMHYDRLECHDMEWLATRGDNLRQVTKEYTVWTQNNFPTFARTVRNMADRCDATIQMGDLSEGLAGTEAKAVEMACTVFGAVDSLTVPGKPFVVAKGNHDITGPGAKEAFNEVYLPHISRLAMLPDTLRRATYSVRLTPDVEVVVYDPWDKKATPELLDSLLRVSDAKHKFVALHEPVIPVNHRCWHVYRRDDARRNDLLRAIASNGAIVLCAHLHKYSVVKRDTEWGPIVQILVNSVVRDLDRDGLPAFATEYGEAMFTGKEDWEPASLDQRRQWVEQEKPSVGYYHLADIPGYGILDINGDDISLNYYFAAETTPIHTINISNLLK